MATESWVINLPITTYLSDEALRSWVNSTRRLFKTLRCPICHHPARVRRGMLLCDTCYRGWPLDDIQDLISEIDAELQIDLEPASSQKQPGSSEPPCSCPGCSI